MSEDLDSATPQDFAEATAWFNECKARRVRDRERIVALEQRAEQAEADFGRALDDEERAKQRAIEAEAEVARMKRLYEIDMRRAEAEVERLNRQRCETCALMTYMECPVWPAIHRAGFTPPPDDFACNLWAERGGEK